METRTKFNYYDILEINPHCPQHEVTTAFERLKSTYSGENPAIYSVFSQDEARQYMHMVEEAYSVLGNKTLRALYDEKIGQGLNKRENVSYEALQAESKIVFNELPKKVSNKPAVYNVDEALEKEIKEQTEWEGTFLKKIRDYKQITLQRMSETTKVSSFYIAAIEGMQTQSLPAVVYVRGYVGQIAKTLGLNEKSVCDSYMKIYRQKLEVEK